MRWRPSICVPFTLRVANTRAHNTKQTYKTYVRASLILRTRAEDEAHSIKARTQRAARECPLYRTCCLGCFRRWLAGLALNAPTMTSPCGAPRDAPPLPGAAAAACPMHVCSFSMRACTHSCYVLIIHEAHVAGVQAFRTSHTNHDAHAMHACEGTCPLNLLLSRCPYPCFIQSHAHTHTHTHTHTRTSAHMHLLQTADLGGLPLLLAAQFPFSV